MGGGKDPPPKRPRFAAQPETSRASVQGRVGKAGWGCGSSGNLLLCRPLPRPSRGLCARTAPRAGAARVRVNPLLPGRTASHFTGEESEAARTHAESGGGAGWGHRPDEPRPGPRRSQWARGLGWGDAASAPGSRRPGHVRRLTDPGAPPRPAAWPGPEPASRAVPGPRPTRPRVPTVRPGSLLPRASERLRGIFCGFRAVWAGVQRGQGQAMSSLPELRDEWRGRHGSCQGCRQWA